MKPIFLLISVFACTPGAARAAAQDFDDISFAESPQQAAAAANAYEMKALLDSSSAASKSRNDRMAAMLSGASFSSKGNASLSAQGSSMGSLRYGGRQSFSFTSAGAGSSGAGGGSRAAQGSKGAAYSKSAGSGSGRRGSKGGGSSAYDDLIKKFAKQYGLEPKLVKSVMKVESGFNPKARSKVGAQGLMQVMPATGKMMAKKIGLGGNPNLYDPKTNIQIGCAYLKYLKGRKGGGSTAAILRGYNGGPQCMTKPTKATSKYARKVMSQKVSI
ncbi:MAG: lytic transglycosylase domain-containing protein [Elusimicrobiales bacterium]